jgi:bacterioferritin-associated ferredoxin
MYVCLSLAISDRTIRRAIDEGARTLEDLGDSCGAGSVCAGCHAELRALLDEARRQGDGTTAPAAKR